MAKGCSSSRTQCGCCGLGEESQVKGRVVLAQSGSGKPTWMAYDDEGGEWQGGGRGRHTCRLYNRQESKSQGREAGMKGAKGEQIGARLWAGGAEWWVRGDWGSEFKHRCFCCSGGTGVKRSGG